MNWLPSARRKILAAAGSSSKAVGLGVEQFGVVAAQHKAVARERNSRRHHRRARQDAVLFERAVEPHHRPRHAGRAPAIAAEVGYGFAGGVEIHPGGRCRRRGLAEIDKGVAPAGEVDDHEPAAADIAAARFDDRERVADRDRRVDCIAAGREDAGADLGGDVLRGHDHAVPSLDRGWRSRRGGAGEGSRQRQLGQYEQDQRSSAPPRATGHRSLLPHSRRVSVSWS